jgi:sec-independent protein translocase protein TatA
LFGLGTQELVIILAIVFLIFGAKKLPEIGSGLGKAIKNFKGGVKSIEEGPSEKPPEEVKKEAKDSGGTNLFDSLCGDFHPRILKNCLPSFYPNQS